MSLVRVFFWAVFFIMILADASVAQQSVLTLVYKDTGKPPYMERAPDNSGLYYDLMSKAAQKIGFGLRVVRVPKKRTYWMLETGAADLYASGEFRGYRSSFLFYMPNGLLRREHYWGMTRSGIPPLHSVGEIKRYGLRWVCELGSSWPQKAVEYDVPYAERPEVSVESAVENLQSHRPFFYQFIKEDIEEYEEMNAIKSWRSMGVQIHESCCESKIAPLYAAFSRHSPHYAEEINPDYDYTKPLSVENFPYRLVPGTVPYRLQEALLEMRDSGEIEALARKYFGEDWDSVIR